MTCKACTRILASGETLDGLITIRAQMNKSKSKKSTKTSIRAKLGGHDRQYIPEQ